MAVANWLEGDNPHGIPAPPDWWLQRLFDFDPLLVLFPSKLNKFCLLARRRQFSAGLGDVAMLDNKHPDTAFCYAHGILPINMRLEPTGPDPWTEATIAFVIRELKKRDAWKVTRGETTDAAVKRLTDKVEDAEKAVEIRKRRNLKEGFYHMGRDAWRSMQARIGTRNKRASDYHGVARVTPKPAGGGTAH